MLFIAAPLFSPSCTRTVVFYHLMWHLDASARHAIFISAAVATFYLAQKDFRECKIKLLIGYTFSSTSLIQNKKGTMVHHGSTSKSPLLGGTSHGKSTPASRSGSALPVSVNDGDEPRGFGDKVFNMTKIYIYIIYCKSSNKRPLFRLLTLRPPSPLRPHFCSAPLLPVMNVGKGSSVGVRA